MTAIGRASRFRNLLLVLGTPRGWTMRDGATRAAASCDYARRRGEHYGNRLDSLAHDRHRRPLARRLRVGALAPTLRAAAERAGSGDRRVAVDRRAGYRAVAGGLGLPPVAADHLRRAGAEPG